MAPTVRLAANVEQVCQDWAAQNACATRLHWTPWPQRQSVHFDAEHLRRVLVNLLDNAARYATQRPEAIQVRCAAVDEQQVSVSVWSDGAPMEQTVERHLFEPFFSSESRSSGLGLYICRELCDRHGASIAYQRSFRALAGAVIEGNEFVVTLHLSDAQIPLPLA